jgi:hypothetical protein
MTDEEFQLRETLKKYLSYGSCDGRVERQPLRKELCKLLAVEYDEREHKLKETM